nr:hypothetical protein [Leucobacter tenebrionis]
MRMHGLHDRPQLRQPVVEVDHFDSRTQTLRNSFSLLTLGHVLRSDHSRQTSHPIRGLFHRDPGHLGSVGGTIPVFRDDSAGIDHRPSMGHSDPPRAHLLVQHRVIAVEPHRELQVAHHLAIRCSHGEPHLRGHGTVAHLSRRAAHTGHVAEGSTARGPITHGTLTDLITGAAIIGLITAAPIADRIVARSAVAAGGPAPQTQRLLMREPPHLDEQPQPLRFDLADLPSRVGISCHQRTQAAQLGAAIGERKISHDRSLAATTDILGRKSAPELDIYKPRINFDEAFTSAEGSSSQKSGDSKNLQDRRGAAAMLGRTHVPQ